MIKIAEIIQLMGEIAPSVLAEDWDNVGLQIGDQSHKVKNVLLALDFNKKVLEEAKNKDCQLIITHHPLIFNSLKSINKQNESGKLIYGLIENNISLFTAHTNLDIAENGLNDHLINKFEVNNIEILKITQKDNYYKLITFIPEEKFIELRGILYEKGAGLYKNYSHSGFFQKGKGTFKPSEKANPYLGEKNKINQFEEIRFETIVAAENLNKVVNALLNNHPYEEVAWDLYKMENLKTENGIGRIAVLKEKILFEEFVEKVKEKYQINNLKYLSSNKKEIKKIALCSGSGADFIKDAYYKGADIYLTGDIKYHEAQLAEELGIALIDFGHYGSEKFVKDLLFDKLNSFASNKILESVNFIKSGVNTDPWEKK